VGNVWGEKQTGGNMSQVEKRWEGKCLGWKNNVREYILDGKTTGGNMS